MSYAVLEQHARYNGVAYLYSTTELRKKRVFLLYKKIEHKEISDMFKVTDLSNSLGDFYMSNHGLIFIYHGEMTEINADANC